MGSNIYKNKEWIILFLKFQHGKTMRGNWPIRWVFCCNTPDEHKISVRRKGRNTRKVKEAHLHRREGIPLTHTHDYWERADTPTPVTKRRTFQPPLDLQSVFVSGPAHSHNANGSKKGHGSTPKMVSSPAPVSRTVTRAELESWILTHFLPPSCSPCPHLDLYTRPITCSGFHHKDICPERCDISGNSCNY